MEVRKVVFAVNFSLELQELVFSREDEVEVLTPFRPRVPIEALRPEMPIAPQKPAERQRRWPFNVVIEVGVDVKVIIRCVGVVRVGLVTETIIGLLRVIAPRII